LIFFSSIKQFFVKRALPTEVQKMTDSAEETLVDIKLCDYCESNVSLDLQICPKCEGTNFNYKSVSMANSVKKLGDVYVNLNDGQTKKCPSCAEEIKFEAIKCRYCQYSFIESNVQKFNTSTEKALRRAFSSKYIGYTITLIIIGIVGIGFGLNARSNSIERNQLLASGEICVYNDDMSINFGCADYPQIKAGLCAADPVYSFYLPDSDYRGLIENGSRGRLASNSNCSGTETPYGFTLVAELREGIGDYPINGTPYAELTSDTYLEGGIFNLFARISLKD